MYYYEQYEINKQHIKTFLFVSGKTILGRHQK